MRKTIIAVGLLAAFGAAHAESSVTLYGNINVAVTKKGSAGVTLKSEEHRYASHIGFSGKEELGNGYSAIFKLEAELQPDTGAGAYGSDGQAFGFNRHSYVGLVTPFGAIRVGRSTSPFVNMWVGGNFAEGRGIGVFTGGLAGAGLRTTQPEVASRWNNALFYDIKKGGLTAGLAVTTKGSQSIVPARAVDLLDSSGTVIAPAQPAVNNEGVSDGKPAYGAYLRYEGQTGMWGYKIGGAYQVDNGSSYSASSNAKNAPAEGKRAWLVGAGLSYGPASLALGYAESKIDNSDIPNTLIGTAGSAPLRDAKSKTMFASVGYNVTPNDHVYVSYGRYQRKNNLQFTTLIPLTGVGEIKGTQVSAGYEHKMSKRTVVYANVRKVFAVTNSCSASTTLPTSSALYPLAIAGGVRGCDRTKGVVNSVLATEA